MKTPPVVLLILVLLLCPSSVSCLDTTGDEDPGSHGTAVFKGEVEVSVVTLYATVVDSKGRPVAGLTADDFEISEGGERQELSFFEAIDASDARALPPTEEATAEAESSSGDSVALVFDNSRLERRARRRVIEALDDMVQPLLGQGTPVMVGVMGPGFELIQSFGSDPAAVRDALARVAETPTSGEALKAERRGLKRDCSVGVSTARNRAMVQAMATAEGTRLKMRIDAFRELEINRALTSLNRIEALVRSFSGRPGHTSLVWVSEDMALRPAVDIYRRFFNRFSTFITLDQPELWGAQRILARDYDRVIAAAQAVGVTVHVVDASNRDAELADTDIRPPDVFTATASQASGRLSTIGYDFAEVTDGIEGSQYLAYGSGGGFFGNTRRFEKFSETFVEAVGTYYIIGYARKAPTDGRAHSIKLSVNRPGLRVRHPEKILDRMPSQVLTDMVVSHLVWGDGVNPLGLEVALEAAAAAADDGSILRPVDLVIPVSGLVATEDGRAHVTVVLCVASSDGTMARPQHLRLALTVPKGDSSLTVGAARVNLRTPANGDRLAVGIRDETSGTTSTVAVPLPAPE